MRPHRHFVRGVTVSGVSGGWLTKPEAPSQLKRVCHVRHSAGVDRRRSSVTNRNRPVRLRQPQATSMVPNNPMDTIAFGPIRPMAARKNTIRTYQDSLASIASAISVTAGTPQTTANPTWNGLLSRPRIADSNNLHSDRSSGLVQMVWTPPPGNGAIRQLAGKP